MAGIVALFTRRHRLHGTRQRLPRASTGRARADGRAVRIRGIDWHQASGGAAGVLIPKSDGGNRTGEALRQMREAGIVAHMAQKVRGEFVWQFGNEFET